MPEMLTYVYDMYMEKLKSLPQPEEVVVEKPDVTTIEKPRPVPIEFEETFVIEKPAEVQLDGMAADTPTPSMEVIDDEGAGQ